MKNPCLTCSHKEKDKNEPVCQECTLRHDYLETLGGYFPGDTLPDRVGICIVQGCSRPVCSSKSGLCKACDVRKKKYEKEGREFELTLSPRARATRTGIKAQRGSSARVIKALAGLDKGKEKPAVAERRTDRQPERSSVCVVEGCDRPVKYSGSGLCAACYVRKRNCQEKGRPFEMKLSRKSMELRNARQDTINPETAASSGLKTVMLTEDRIALDYQGISLEILPAGDSVLIGVKGYSINVNKDGAVLIAAA